MGNPLKAITDYTNKATKTWRTENLGTAEGWRKALDSTIPGAGSMNAAVAIPAAFERKEAGAKSAVDRQNKAYDNAKASSETGFDASERKMQDAENLFQGRANNADYLARQGVADYQGQRDNLDKNLTASRQAIAGAEAGTLANYTADTRGIANEFTAKANDLSNQSSSQAADATKVYQNSIMPNMMNNLENANNQYNTVNKQAMSLQQLQDPNNQVAQDTRNLYGQQANTGAARYDADIQGARNQGLADYGVLASLGAQATAGQLAGAPRTGAQMQAMGAQNQAQASEAYNSAQKQMRGLQDQQRVYREQLESRGLEAGREDSKGAYDRGQSALNNAMDRQSARVADLMAGQQDYGSLMGNYRGEQSGYAKDVYGAKDKQANTEMAAADRILATQAGLSESKFNMERSRIAENLGISKEMAGQLVASGQREAGILSGRAQRELQQSDYINNLELAKQGQAQAMRNANNQSNMGLATAGIGAVATGIGAMTGAAPLAAGGAALATSGMQQASSAQVQPNYYQAPQAPSSQYPVSQGFSPYGPYQGGYRYGY